MNTTITPDAFTFNNQQLRHVVIDGEPWFHTTDACKILGLSLSSGTYQHTVKLDGDEKRTIRRTPNLTQESHAFIGRTSGAGAVSESGLYKLILRSDKPQAKPFQNWVTKEVLPVIRKTGGYLLNEDARQTAHADTREAMPLPAEVSESSEPFSLKVREAPDEIGGERKAMPETRRNPPFRNNPHPRGDEN